MTDYVLSAELSLKDRFTSKIKSAFKNSELFKRKMEETDEKLRRFGQAPKLSEFSDKMNDTLQKIDQTKIKLSNLGDFSKFNNGLNKFSSNFVNKVNGMVGTGAKLLKWGAVGSTGLGIGALKIGSDFEALGARMETAFQGNKKKAAEYFKWANEFANKTPFSNDEVIDATVRLKSYGYDPKRLMTILGDMAGAYGKTLEQSVEAYADASRGEYERLKEFGIQKDEVINFAKEEMGKEIKMSGERVLDMDTFMKALEGLIKSRSKDGMKHLANTLSGMLSTTKGLLKYNIAKLVGVTDEGNVRAGSLMERVKEKFESFNTYIQSPEGKAAFDKWVKAFDDAIPKVIEIGKSIKNKLTEIFGTDYLESFNKSIQEFNPTSFNQKLQSIKDNFDELTEKVMRIAGVYAGMQLLKVNPYLGVLAMTAGAFTPEIIDTVKKALEYNEHRKQLMKEAEEKEEKVPIRISGATEETNKYLDDFLNGKTKNTGVEFNFKGNKEKNVENKISEIYSEKQTIKEKVENIKSENEVINDFAKEIVNIDNRVFNTTTNNYIKDEKTEDNSEKSYNSLNNYESNRIDNSKSITNSEINNNSFSSQNNIDNSKSSVSDNELSNIYNSENNNDNSKVYNSETENKNDNSKHIVNNKEVSNTHNSSSTNNTTDNSKVYNNNTETKEVKEKVRTLKQNITNHNNITIKIDGAITNRDDKIAYENIANKLRTELQKTIDKTFENMTTEIEFA